MKIIAVCLAIIYCLGVFLFLYLRKRKVGLPKTILDEPLITSNSSRLVNETITLEDKNLGISVTVLKEDLEINELREAGHLVFELQTFLKLAKSWKKNDPFIIESSIDLSEKVLFPSDKLYTSRNIDDDYFKKTENSFDSEHRDFNDTKEFIDSYNLDDEKYFKVSPDDFNNVEKTSFYAIVDLSNELLDESNM